MKKRLTVLVLVLCVVLGLTLPAMAKIVVDNNYDDTGSGIVVGKPDEPQEITVVFHLNSADVTLQWDTSTGTAPEGYKSDTDTFETADNTSSNLQPPPKSAESGKV